jgi:Outer membrane protein beta-barrel domain
MRPENHIDSLFARSFDNFETPPSTHLWSGIESSLSEQHLDNFFRDKLVTNEVQPESYVWHGVRKNLPLSPFIKQHLQLLSGMAGALLLGMLAFHITDIVEQSKYSASLAAKESVIAPNVFKLNKEAYNGAALDKNINLKWNAELDELYAEHNAIVQSSIDEIRTKYEGVAESQFNQFIASAGILPDGSILTWDKSAKVGEKVFASLRASDLALINAALDKQFFGKEEVMFFMPIEIENADENSIYKKPIKPDVQPVVIAKRTEQRISVVGFGQVHHSQVLNIRTQDETIAVKLPTYTSGGGVNVNIPLSNKVGIQTGFEIMNLEQKYQFLPNPGSTEEKFVSASYLRIPLSVSLEVLNLKDKGSFVFNAGTFVGFKVNQKTSRPQDAVSTTPAASNELGITLGLDYQKFFKGNIGVMLSARTSLSSDLSKLDQLFGQYGTTHWINGFRAGVMYRFDGKK